MEARWPREAGRAQLSTWVCRMTAREVRIDDMTTA